LLPPIFDVNGGSVYICLEEAQTNFSCSAQKESRNAADKDVGFIQTNVDFITLDIEAAG
jgi:hypothetical protein